MVDERRNSARRKHVSFVYAASWMSPCCTHNTLVFHTGRPNASCAAMTDHTGSRECVGSDREVDDTHGRTCRTFHVSHHSTDVDGVLVRQP